MNIYQFIDDNAHWIVLGWIKSNNISDGDFELYNDVFHGEIKLINNDTGEKTPVPYSSAYYYAFLGVQSELKKSRTILVEGSVGNAWSEETYVGDMVYDGDELRFRFVMRDMGSLSIRESDE